MRKIKSHDRVKKEKVKLFTYSKSEKLLSKKFGFEHYRPQKSLKIQKR